MRIGKDMGRLIARLAEVLLKPKGGEDIALSAAEAKPADERTIGLFAEALPDPCLIIDYRSIITYRNAAASQQFADALPGNPLAFSIRNPAVLGAVETVRQTGIAQSIELHQAVPNETWHRVSVAALGSDPNLIIVILHNLTEARRVDAMRADFIANASHELRTPLTSLVGFIDTLLGPAARDAEARGKFLVIMQGQANRMAKLIDDLLSLSRIEMHQHLRPTGQVDLALLLGEVSQGLQTQAGHSGVTIKLDVAEAAVVTGDRNELYEVFENLVENAIKYGGDGGTVDVVLGPASDRHGYDYSVTVTDHGAGIAEEHVPRLTERFYRVDADSSRRKKGTGLGLAIVKHIVNRHRGLLVIRSKPGEGTRVEVLLPK